MADDIGEAAWKAFTRKQKLTVEDGALLKALARFDRGDGGKPAQQLEALADVGEQLRKLATVLSKSKKEMGDKPYAEAKGKIDDWLVAAAAQEKRIKAAEAERAAQAEEDEDSPVLLTTKMLPLVRQLLKGDTTMKALIALSGRQAAVLIMRRDIAPARRKLLAEYLAESGGLKYVKADCSGISGQLTFSLDSAPGGLAKKVRQALLDQIGLRLRVRLEFGGEAEDDGEAEGEEGEGDASTPQAALAQWQAARGAAVAQLQRLEAEVKACDDPLADQALIRIRAVRAQLSEAPQSAQAVDELASYLSSDRIVEAVEAPNGFGFAVALRQPLLAALGRLRPALAPAALH